MMENSWRKFCLWTPLICWVAIIFWFSHQPKMALAPVQPSAFATQSEWGLSLFHLIDWDTVAGKGAHLAVFGLLAFCVWRVWPDWKFVLSIVLMIAVLDEFHQLFIDGRTGRVLDVFIDVLGAIFVLYFLSLRHNTHKNVERQ